VTCSATREAARALLLCTVLKAEGRAPNKTPASTTGRGLVATEGWVGASRQQTSYPTGAPILIWINGRLDSRG
jgi:hypothetical protein